NKGVLDSAGQAFGKMDEIGLRNINEKGADIMSIKMTLPNGSVIEGTAEELAELNEIINGEEQAEEETFSKPAQVGDIIRITDARITEDEYENGDIMTVEKMLGRKVDNE